VPIVAQCAPMFHYLKKLKKAIDTVMFWEEKEEWRHAGTVFPSGQRLASRPN
jgi:hypothetical protein